MYCLDKLQNILSDYLHLDKETMPNVKDILKDKGYTIVKKGEDFIELKDGELQKLQAIDLDSIDKSIQELDIEIDRVMKGKSLFEPNPEAEKLRKAQSNLEYTEKYLRKLKAKEVEATPSAPSLNKSINDNPFKIDKAREDLKQNQSKDTIKNFENAKEGNLTEPKAETKASDLSQIKQNAKGDYLITTKDGKRHIIKSDIARQWLETFNLKSLDDEFIPKFDDEIKEILAKQGIDTDAFKININDLIKLQNKGRMKYVKEIEPTFNKPNFVFKDEQGDIIFAKEINNKLYFANVTRLYNDEFLSVSLSPKTQNTIKNKLEKAKEVYYKSPELRDSSAHKASTDFLSSVNSDSNTIIPQNSKAIDTTPTIYENLNETLKEAYDIFKAYNKDEYNNALFDRVIQVANNLDARYWTQSNPKWVRGTYTFWLNRAMVDSKLLDKDAFISKKRLQGLSENEIQKELDEHLNKTTSTLLHELIHSTTSRAIHAYDNGLKDLLSKEQIQGIEELKNLYKVVRDKNKNIAWQTFNESSQEYEKNLLNIYGLKNEHEFLAELSKPKFRDFLKEQNLFTRIIKAIAKIFGYESKSADDIATNALSEAEQALYKIMDNYKDDFSQKFDDIYKQIDFVDFDNYKDYIRKHTVRVRSFLKSRDIDRVKKITYDMKEHYYNDIQEAQQIRYVDIKEFFEVESDFNKYPLGKFIDEVSFMRYERQEVEKYHPRLGDITIKEYVNLPYLASKEYLREETFLALKPLFTSGIYKQLDSEATNLILDGIENILKKDLKYKTHRINSFFARDFVDKFVEKFAKAENALGKIEVARGNLSKNENSPNIYYSNQHIGSGSIVGTINGLETDEQGNITGFSPEKFVLGFIGGATASKVGIETIKRLSKYPRAREALNKIQLKNDIIPALKQGKKMKEQDIIKALENSPQKGQGMVIIGRKNLSTNILKWVLENNKKIAIDTLPKQTAKKLGFKYPNVKRTIGASEINHTLNRHGADSNLVKNSGQKVVTLDDIKRWTDYSDDADFHTLSKDDLGQDVIISGKQINGYYVVIESIRRKNNELSFKTMYFQNGDILQHKDFEKFK